MDDNSKLETKVQYKQFSVDTTSGVIRDCVKLCATIENPNSEVAVTIPYGARLPIGDFVF